MLDGQRGARSALPVPAEAQHLRRHDLDDPPGEGRDPKGLQFGDLRTLYFENDAFSTNDSREMSWERDEDNWHLKVGDGERYWIPDAVIWGG